MDRARLRAVLAGGSSIVFDARPRALVDKSEAPGDGFFASRLLRNVVLVKLVESGESAANRPALQTLLYFPYDPQAIGDGGGSIAYSRDQFRLALERNFGVEKLDEAKFTADLTKLDVFCRMPSFSPFLLRDAFERARIDVNRSFFAITESEADAVRDRLKTKLKPLAAMALDLSADMIGGGQLELLVRKLWQLDDPQFLLPLSRALQIPDGEAMDVFYSWIGVSYFQSEFVAREARVKVLAEWIAKKSTPFEYVASLDLKEYQANRMFVRDRLRSAWSGACDVFARFDKSYRSLILSGGDPKPFVDFLRTVRADFNSLGEGVSMIDQCLSVFDYWIGKVGTQRVHYDVLRQIMACMREIWMDADKPLPIAPSEAAKVAV
jgi:hypothetical protein